MTTWPCQYIAVDSVDVTGWACAGFWFCGWAVTCAAMAREARGWRWQTNWRRQVLVMASLLLLWPCVLVNLMRR